MRKLIVIPARGGSKGIPYKNIYPLSGKPLIEYTLDVIYEARLSGADTVVSTDDKKIKDVVKKYKWITVIDRPAAISGDTASTEAVLIHALEYMQEVYGRIYDAVLTMQVTSPFRRAETFCSFVHSFEKKYPLCDAMLSLNEDRTDFWVRNDEDGFERLYPDAPRRRQDRKPLYVENSAYYITEVTALRETNSVLGNRAEGYIIPRSEALDINEPIDLIMAESMIKAKLQMKE